MAVIPGTLGYIAYKTEVGLILVPSANWRLDGFWTDGFFLVTGQVRFPWEAEGRYD